MRVAIIPARGGSKRIKRKNLRPFNGRPMIDYAVAVARDCGLFDRIIVSTDDLEIADQARLSGAEVPFMRPAELADDHTPTQPVMAHAIEELNSQGEKIDVACCIYPAVPLLQASTLSDAFALFEKHEGYFCFPVLALPSPVHRAMQIDAQGFLNPIFAENQLKRSQDLPVSYYDAGQFYWGSARSWLTQSEVHAHAVGLPLSTWQAVDIDTEEDWKWAERLAAGASGKRTE